MDADSVKKLATALSIIDSMESQLSNFLKRAPEGLKLWTEGYKNRDTKQQAILKNDVIKVTLNLIKDAKTVQKDLAKLYAEGSEPKKLSAYPDMKAFKSKCVDKLLASSKKFEGESMKMKIHFFSILGDGFYIGQGTPGSKVTMDSVDNFHKYFTALKVALAKV